MKTLLQIGLWIACIVLGYFIYNSINGPIEFKKVKQERFTKVISSLKDIRNSQEAYKTVNKRFASNFGSLIKFVETGEYVITQQRDSSFLRFSKAYGIDQQVDTVLIDTLKHVSVKDSLFKNDDRFKTMMDVPYALNGEKFEMKAGTIDKSGYNAAVFEAKVLKDVVLGDQAKDLVKNENAKKSVEEVDGIYIQVGSMDEVSTNGNWPPIYDRKGDN